MKKTFLFLVLFLTNTSPLICEDSAVEFLYDASKNRIQMKDRFGITSYRYDNKNRLTQITFPNQKAIEFAYNAQDRIAKVVYPNKKFISYDYDEKGRITTVEEEEGTTTFFYNKEHLSKIKRPSGMPKLSRCVSLR